MTEAVSDPAIDLLIIGGGINGAGIARDAAGRGLKVVLCEKKDLAAATSSASSKLIHGGLRYLEYYEFRLVREALKEREVLLKLAPHIIWPLRFVLPHHKGLRPKWMLRTGLFLYDYIGGRRELPPTKTLDLRTAPAGNQLKDEFVTGFEYSDCWVEDSRLVVLNALDAYERGAEILVGTTFVSADREDGVWSAKLVDADGQERTIRARALVNAAGPWVSGVVGEIGPKKEDAKATLRLVKGSHLIVKRQYEGEHAYILQNTDGRIVFCIPYEGEYTLVGTTDVIYEDDVEKVEISDEETDYILELASGYFKTPLTRDDIVADYSGVRPLYDDNDDKEASAVTRDYVFDVVDDGGQCPVLSIYGGKITTYRKLSEHALEKLHPYFPSMAKGWTGDAALPGGDMPEADFDAYTDDLTARYGWLDPQLLRRLARAYGTRIEQVIGDASSMNGMGQHFGGGLTERELEYLVKVEWARTAEDVLWRRSKLALHLSEDAQHAVEAWFSRRFPEGDASAIRSEMA